MLFNSFEFLFIFLPVVLFTFFMLGRISARHAIAGLGIASLAFYSYWDIWFLPVLAISILANFGMSHWIARAKTHRKAILSLAVAGNLAALYFYKYLDFTIISLNTAFGLNLPPQALILPLGISFFTFTQIAYLVDMYRHKAATSKLSDYILFVSYFPHLIAGPILHHAHMMPQFHDTKILKPSTAAISAGLVFLTIGLVKKVIIADHFADFSSPIFAIPDPSSMGAYEAWVGALSYTMQLYFDFSGYCDMAIGISLMFNINLPINFSSPYKAANIIDFWRRWHMTLSQFLRDYLYIPLGGNRHGKLRRYINLFLTMLLGGLWHGANWTFVIWGCLHGLYLIINHGFVALRQRFGLAAIPTPIALAITFLAVVVAWVPFRANDIHQALALWQVMFTPDSGHQYVLSGVRLSKATRWIIGGLIVVLFLPNSQALAERFQQALRNHHNSGQRWVLFGVLLGLVFSITVLSIGHVSEFLYFQF